MTQETCFFVSWWKVFFRLQYPPLVARLGLWSIHYPWGIHGAGIYANNIGGILMGSMAHHILAAPWIRHGLLWLTRDTRLPMEWGFHRIPMKWDDVWNLVLQYQNYSKFFGHHCSHNYPLKILSTIEISGTLWCWVANSVSDWHLYTYIIYLYIYWCSFIF